MNSEGARHAAQDRRKKRIRLSLRSKALVVLGAAVLLLMGLLYFIGVPVWMKGYAQLEDRDARLNVSRVADALDAENKTLIRPDWASWDDTYRFVKDLNEAYIHSNLTEEALQSLQVQGVLYFDADGNLVFSKFYWPGQSDPHAAPGGLMSHFEASSRLLQHAAPNPNHYGLLNLPGRLVSFASMPILTSKGEGPSRGSIVMVREFDSGQVKRLSEVTHFKVQLYRIGDPKVPPEAARLKRNLEEAKQAVVEPVGEELLEAYDFARDAYGQPAGILFLALPRPVEEIGQVSLRRMLGTMALASLLFIAATVILMEWLVLNPLGRITRELARMHTSGDLTTRLSLSGTDEMGLLTATLNPMLGEIEESLTHLASFPLEDPNPVLEMTREGAVTYENVASKTAFPTLAQTGTAHPFLQGMEEALQRLSANPGGRIVREVKVGDAYYNQSITGIKGGSLIRIYSIETTQNKRLEEELRQAQKMEAIGVLAGGVAHDFNNLLNVITGYAEKASDTLPKGNPVREDLAKVTAAATRAADLTRKLLAFSRHQVLEMKMIDVNAVVDEFSRMLSRIVGDDVEVRIAKAPGAAVVYGDPGQLDQVLLNLCVNARQAMPRGGVLTIETSSVQVEDVFARGAPGGKTR